MKPLRDEFLIDELELEDSEESSDVESEDEDLLDAVGGAPPPREQPPRGQSPPPHREIRPINNELSGTGTVAINYASGAQKILSLNSNRKRTNAPFGSLHMKKPKTEFSIRCGM